MARLVVALFEEFWETLDDYAKFSSRHIEVRSPFELEDL